MNAMNAHRNMGMNTVNSGKSMEKLSSGLRINRAGDDAAGLAISEKMRGQIRGLDQAARNSQDGISMIQTAEGALNETHSILQRMRELAIQAGNDTNTTGDREEIQKEMNQLTSEINRIGNTTEFNTQKLLNGNRTGDAAAAIPGTDEVLGKTGDIAIADFTKNVIIDGTDLGVVADIDALKDAVNNNATLKEKYTATVNGTKLVLEQKTGHGSATAPTVDNDGAVTFTMAKAGAAEVKEIPAKEGKARLQVGANANQSMVIDIADMRASILGISGKVGDAGFTDVNTVNDGTKDVNEEAALSVASHELASNAVEKLDIALRSVSSERSKLGAMQNRLEHTINNLGTSSENLTAAESRIRDVDMAKEMMTFSKNNILSQAAQAMLAQANQQPQDRKSVV